MARQARHSARHLIGRVLVAAASTAAVAVGVYPVGAHVRRALARRQQGRARPRGLAALGPEWAVSIGMHAARPLGFFGLPARARTVRGPRPIIAVHGYAMSRTCFRSLARRLADAGLGPVLGFEYWSLGRVERAAQDLGAYIERVCRDTGSPEVDIIGHSMGGVVGRYYITLGGGSARVRHLVTIGSPHNGSYASAFGVGHPREELLVDSPFLKHLQAQPLPDDTDVTVLWSRSDALVPSAYLARIAGVHEVCFDDIGHLALLVDARVAAAVIERLRG